MTMDAGWLFRGMAVMDDEGMALLCDECPCAVCTPRVIASVSVDGRYEGENMVDFSRWRGDGIGYPGAEWRVIEVTDCIPYFRGVIDENGKLVGLPQRFESEYHYRGYLEIQQSCRDEFGAVTWPYTECEHKGESTE